MTQLSPWKLSRWWHQYHSKLQQSKLFFCIDLRPFIRIHLRTLFVWDVWQLKLSDCTYTQLLHLHMLSLSPIRLLYGWQQRFRVRCRLTESPLLCLLCSPFIHFFWLSSQTRDSENPFLCQTFCFNSTDLNYKDWYRFK